MDTDGYASKNGSVAFYTTSKKLAEDVQYLIRSLGGICKINEKIRKKNRAVRIKKDIIRKCKIKNIEKLCVEEVQCINIDHPDHLYITNDFIVTHNTFPKEWWQELVSKIAQKIPVCLVGTNSEENRGVFSLDIPDNSIDLVDRTSLGSLMAAISKAPILLSNDSAPVHIAGAFDNWVVLIPSCKHPEHVLPYREGTVWHKAKALYKALTLDDVDQRPTAWFDGGTSGAECKRPWDAYLPDVSQVYKEVIDLSVRNS